MVTQTAFRMASAEMNRAKTSHSQPGLVTSPFRNWASSTAVATTATQRQG